MKKETTSKINVQGLAITIINNSKDDYISITDIARHRDADRSDYILQNWLRNRSTIEYIGLWEQLKNPNFNSIEFDGIKNMAGSNSFSLTPKRWIETTNAIGIVSKTGRYGGTFAHKDIALEFASWISAEFKMYLIVEFQRLKDDENERLSLEWNLNRTLAKINYKIHTDALKNYLIPKELSVKEQGIIYANEADVLNMALFSKTAKQWKQENPEKEGNIRDYATIHQLVVLVNIESFNAELIRLGLSQSKRLMELNQIAIRQLKAIVSNPTVKKLNDGK
jgi:hypothetical protein